MAYIMTRIDEKTAHATGKGTVGISKIDTAEQVAAALVNMAACGMTEADILDGGPPSRAK